MSPWIPLPLALAATLMLGTAVPSFAQATAAAEAEHVHVSQRGDTLIGLGRRLLIEPSAWREIARLNRLANPDRIPVGTRLRVGGTLLEVSQIGKECHTKCAIYYQAGDCVMPKEGIFATVVEGGAVSVGDEIAIVGESA